MDSLNNATFEAMQLLASGDSELWNIIGISFKVSSTAILIATPPSLLMAFLLAYGNFPGRRLLISVFSTLLSIPAVVVGLTLYLMLSRQGPMGDLKLLFTQSAMVIGQIVLCVPILVAMRTLGAGPVRAVLTVMHEVRFGLFAALLAAYGRIIAEVGASMMLGGNILNSTRNIPTAIALETSKGEFSQGIALGIVLLLLAFILNGLLHYFQGKGRFAT
jgi:tungstate transport system permease protein